MTIERKLQCIDVARRVFQEIAALSPLSSSIQVEPIPELALTLDFEVQPGLLFPVSANLQNVDELHLNVGAFFEQEWFPCSEPKVAAEFREAIQGVLSGEYRVVESYRNDRPTRAELQRAENGTWKRVGLWTKLRFPSLRTIKTHILQNTTPDT